MLWGYLADVYATGSRGEHVDQTSTRQQRKADLAFALCPSRDLPVKHNSLPDTPEHSPDAYIMVGKSSENTVDLVKFVVVDFRAMW